MINKTCFSSPNRRRHCITYWFPCKRGWGLVDFPYPLHTSGAPKASRGQGRLYEEKLVFLLKHIGYPTYLSKGKNTHKGRWFTSFKDRWLKLLFRLVYRILDNIFLYRHLLLKKQIVIWHYVLNCKIVLTGIRNRMV